MAVKKKPLATNAASPSVASILDELTRVAAAMKVKGANKAATTEALSALEKLLQASLHPDLRALWKWRADPDCLLSSGTLGLDLDDRQVWLSPRDAASALKALRDSKLPSTLVPISTDEAGNYFCHDRKSGKVFDWDHETRKARVLAPSLAALLGRSLKRALRTLRETEREEAEKPAPTPSPAAGARVLPKRIQKRANPFLARLDSKGYAGGAKGALLTHDGTGLILEFGTNITLYELAKKKEVLRVPGFDAPQFSVSKSGICASGCAHTYSNMALFDAKTGKIKSRWHTKLVKKKDDDELTAEHPVAALIISEDGNWVAGMGDSGASVWRTRDLPTSTVELGADRVRGPLLGPNRPKVVAAPTPPVVPRMFGTEKVLDIALTNDSLLTLTEAQKGYGLDLWSLDTGKKVASVALDTFPACAAISPDGARIVFRANSGTTMLFDGSLKLLKQWKAHAEPKGYPRNGDLVRFSRSSEFFVSSGAGELKVWSSEDGKLLATTKLGSTNAFPNIAAVLDRQVLTVTPLGVFELT
jgi:hypothetical protein